MIVDLAVSSQEGAVGEYDMVANNAVVPDMAIGHQETVVSYGCCLIGLGCTVDSNAFSNDAVFTDANIARYCGIKGQILRLVSSHAEGVQMRSCAKMSAFFKNHVGVKLYIRLNRASVFNDTERANMDVVGKLSIGVNLCAWVDHSE